ncbi:hypothetical protein M8J76_012580 [Diaphorina citri]|nr:hypothetical protein M8J75_009791 [Diaphorina citri]KAI5727005.1 hypothetical protein M8J76_012580 [Diaphorina citri]
MSSETAKEVKKALAEFFVSDTFTKIVEEAVTNAMNQKMEELLMKVKELEDKNEHLENRIDDLEQYGRRNNIRIFGINKDRSKKIEDKDLEHEVISEINQKTGCGITTHQIEACHYLDKNKTNVIVRFVSRKTRDEVFYKKKGFKGTKISITEDLTKKNYTLLKECQQNYDKKYIWTKYGIVKMNVNGKIMNVRTRKDLEDIKKK